MEPSDYLMFTLFLWRIYISFLLARRYLKSKNPQLKILLTGYMIQSFSHIFNFSFLLVPALFYIFWEMGLMIYAYFIDQTFFKNQKRHFTYIYLSIFIFSILSVSFEIWGTYYVKSPLHIEEIIGSWCFAISSINVNVFLLNSVMNGYRKIKPDVTIEPWIKMKYKMIMIYCICYIVSMICWPLSPEDSLEIGITVIVGVIFNFISVGFEFLVWGNHKMLKKYVNRKFIEELPIGFNYINFLGKVIADKFNEPILKCTGLIRLALNDSIGDINIVNFTVLHNTIDTSLRIRLNRIYSTEIDIINELIEDLHLVLEDKQSVLTIGYA